MKEKLLDVDQLCVHYKQRNKQLSILTNISFSLYRGEIIGLGGESGSGKTTLARAVMGLLKEWNGDIFVRNQNLKDLMKSSSIEWRRHQQMVFQNPSASLNPSMRIQEILLEPFIIHKVGDTSSRVEAIKSLLNHVGLPESHLNFFPYQLSGGQKQRIALARAIALHPQLLICDEPFSSLDVSVRAQVVNLLKAIQKQHDMSIFLISHDLSLLRYFTDRLFIMFQGHFVEWGSSREVYDSPLHPYTQALVDSVLECNNLNGPRKPLLIRTDESYTLNSQKTCPFFKRCPRATKLCESESPTLREVTPGRFISCHNT